MSDSRRRRWALTSARVVIGTGVAVAAVIAVTAGVAAPWPTLSAQPVRVQATPAPSESVIACDGPLLALGRTVEQAGELSIAAPQQVVSGPAATEAVSSALTAPAGATPAAFSALPSDDSRAELAASGSATIADPDLRGFAASACTPPLMESWLVGGATTTGSNDLVVLANPGEVPATVQLTVYGAGGSSTPPGGRDVVVRAGAQVVISLPGLLPGEESPVVRVTSTGAPVSASLQSSLIRILTPGGVDQVAAIPAATTRQVVPGVSVVAAPDPSNPATIVRLLSPSADGEATVTLSEVDGAPVGEASTVPLAAGVPSALELGGLAAGSYTVTVDGSVPIVASVWETTGFGEGSDFAWYASAPEVATPSVLAVPAGPAPMLTVANPGTVESEVSVVTLPTGDPARVTVPAQSSVSVPVRAGELYRLEPSAPVHATVGFSSAGALAGFPVWAADAAAPPLTVYP
jgi:hypothetical protein